MLQQLQQQSAVGWAAAQAASAAVKQTAMQMQIMTRVMLLVVLCGAANAKLHERRRRRLPAGWRVWSTHGQTGSGRGSCGEQAATQRAAKMKAAATMQTGRDSSAATLKRWLRQHRQLECRVTL
jgi:hypothetical protein